MKKHSVLLIVFLLFIVTGRSQTYGFDVELKNFEQVDETTIEWDIYLKKADGTSDFALWQMQTRIEFNNDILNTGNFTNASFTIKEVGSNMNQETDFFDDDDCTVVGTSPNIQLNWAVSSPPDVNQSMTIISDSWLKVATFEAQLMKSGNPQNFADADPELAFETIGANILVTRANTTSTTYDGSGITPVPRNVTIPSLGVKVNDRQLAGYWFSGDGNWSETGRWNNVTTENANTLPGANSSAIINGNCTISGSKASYSLLPDGNGNGGELTVLTGEEPLFSIELVGNGNGVTVTLYDSEYNVISGAFADNVTAGTQFAINTSGIPPSGSFINWTDQDGSVIATSQYYEWYTMPSNDVILTANWTSGTKTVKEKVKNTDELYASLTIAPGASLTVDKLFNDSENSSEAVIIQSTASGTGSLIHNNTGVQATVERYINRWSAKGEEHGWHFLSSPVASQAIRPEFVPDGNPIPDYIDFYKWDESHFEQGEYGWWINVKDASNNWNTSFEDNFEVGRGYLMAYGTPPKEYGDKAHLFQGEVNVENVTLTGLTHTTGSSHPGWHLVGNPYASAIDWSSGSWTKTNIGDKPQIWDESTASYVVLSALTSTIIPAHNGFMVYTPGAGELTIPADARTHSSTAWYKSGEEDYILLVADDPQGETSQQTIITFNPEATEGFDLAYDAKFLSGYAPMFYSVSQEEAFALNTLPSQNGEITIPLGFVKNSSEEFTISLAGGIQEESIILADMKTNKEQNLVENPVYTFTSEEGDDPNRFLLKLGTVMINETQVNQMDAWVYNKLLHFNSTSNKTTVEVIDITGRPLYTRTVHGTGHQTMPLQMQPGAYIIRLQNEDAIRSLKTIL